MNHAAEARMQGRADARGQIGVHMNANVRVVVPLSAAFTRPVAKPMKVDASKIHVKKP